MTLHDSCDQARLYHCLGSQPVDCDNLTALLRHNLKISIFTQKIIDIPLAISYDLSIVVRE
ncbi:hypothetical protein R2R35_05840 [Anaerocolumna sp. AGMB13020]|uniref:hypothetical protein n=1 Tax=Anaerocolumna sp. AGMB13020 TaxID=3081750 RepID=UPI00295540E9|nr:hypothetical protein [Anaerocolumna sp. AGMB13020]WOO38023.1 hypothetical protein R2R35_05840 [Anaerocolumna sp. AGMB13020]